MKSDQLPGQPQQVTVRFAPTAAGSFNGSAALMLSGTRVRWSDVVLDRGPSQCLEQSVAQGSANVALAGTAHKVKIEPQELDFGVVFVGGTRERKLTVKNEGTTTTTLEIPNTTLGTATYFRIMELPQNTLVLGPGQSTGIAVRFTPTASGTLTESLRLISRPHVITVPVMGMAYAKEEFEEAIYQVV